VADPKGQGRLFARHEASNLVGPIQNAQDLPEDRRHLDTRLVLIVASISSDGKQIQFRYPTARDEDKTKQTDRKRKDSRGGQPPQRRR
jgi:hypothetical protein